MLRRFDWLGQADPCLPEEPVSGKTALALAVLVINRPLSPPRSSAIERLLESADDDVLQAAFLQAEAPENIGTCRRAVMLQLPFTVVLRKSGGADDGTVL